MIPLQRDAVSGIVGRVHTVRAHNSRKNRCLDPPDLHFADRLQHVSGLVLCPTVGGGLQFSFLCVAPVS